MSENNENISREPNELSPELKEMALRLAELYDNAYGVYSQIVGSILCDAITDRNEIEHIMDGLLDFAEDPKFVELYKELCRHIYYRYPKLVTEHVALFLEERSKTDEFEDEW